MTTQATAHTPVKFNLSYKVVWGIAALGTSLISGTYGALLPIFYQDYLGLSAGWIATASAIYAIWNAINDPLFGYITDSSRLKGGRRIPFMRYTAPFLAFTFILVWFAPQGLGDRTLFFWMLGTMLLYDTCYTIIGLVYSALLPEVSESDAERNGLQISASLFGLLGMILGELMEQSFRRALILTNGDPLVFFTRPISLVCLTITAAIFAWSIISGLRQKAKIVPRES